MKLFFLNLLVLVTATSSFAGSFVPKDWLGSYEVDVQNSDPQCEAQDLVTISQSEDESIHVMSDGPRVHGIVLHFPTAHSYRDYEIRHGDKAVDEVKANSNSLHYIAKSGAFPIGRTLIYTDNKLSRNEDGSVEVESKLPYDGGYSGYFAGRCRLVLKK